MISEVRQLLARNNFRKIHEQENVLLFSFHVILLAVCKVEVCRI